MAISYPEVVPVIAPVPVPQVPQPLAEGINGHTVETVGIITGIDEGLRIFIDGLSHRCQVPFAGVPYPVSMTVFKGASFTDRRRNLPKPAGADALAPEGGIFTGIGNHKEMPGTGHFFAHSQALVVDGDNSCGSGICVINGNLIPISLTGEIRLHFEYAIISAEGTDMEVLVVRIILHIHGSGVIGKLRHIACVGHLPFCIIGKGNLCICSAYVLIVPFLKDRRCTSKQGIGCREIQKDFPLFTAYQISQYCLLSSAGKRNEASFAL